jgi:hypothetical protein
MRISTAASSKDAFPGVAPEIKFAGDSLLEESGFEPSVPPLAKGLPGVAEGRSRNDPPGPV